MLSMHFSQGCSLSFVTLIFPLFPSMFPSFPFSGWPHSAISISGGCDVSPQQAINSDLSAFFQAIHKNSANTSKRCPCLWTHLHLYCPRCPNCSFHLPLLWLATLKTFKKTKHRGDCLYRSIRVIYMHLKSFCATVKRVNSNTMNVTVMVHKLLCLVLWTITGVSFLFSSLLCVFLWASICVRYNMPGSGRQQLCVGPWMCCAAIVCHW